ncbi:MAG: phosphotransferase [Chloroflexota bacterium]
MTEQADASPEKSYLSIIDEKILAPLVAVALGHDQLKISQWHYDRVYGGAGDVGEVLSVVFRFTGIAYDQTKPVNWTLILKVVGTTAIDDDPTASRYWKREVSAYQSGDLKNLPGDLATPQFFGITEFSETVVGLWLEDVTDQFGSQWPLADYGLAARHLGQFNGAFLINQNLPHRSWFLKDRFRDFYRGTQVGQKFTQLRQSLNDPQTQRWFIDDNDANRILHLWEERTPLLEALNRLPQTVVHGDAFRRNLFAKQVADGRYQTVAVDWTFTGLGPIGFELASLVQGTLFFSEVDMTDAQALDQIVFEGYLTGLEDAGWRGDPSQARLGYAAGSAIVFALGYGAFKLNQQVYPWLEQAFGLPIDQFMQLGAKLNHFFLTLADEARTLLD